ncbi:hypothetical protein GGH13_008116 [Coemansia sp. S155-1]|nr:hypothetical protein GGH13_008116 [Coemansia sp. S155-1]
MSTADRSLGFGDSPHHTSAEKTVVVNFAHRLKRLAPAATDLHLFITPTGGTQARHTQFHGLLISTLCRAGIKGVHVYAEQATIPVSLDVQCLSLLTKITQGKGVACGPFARLAYLNANTLQMLSINVGTEDDWLGLIYGGSKVSATFHRLDELILQFTDVSYEEIWTAIDFLAPFPALWMLEVFDRYPFDDDLLFRRNGKTMKHLRIPFCALVENIMGRFKVLSRSGVSRMDLVRIEAVLDADDADDTDDVDDVDDAGDADDADDADDEFEAERVDAAIKQQLHCILKTTAALFISEDTFDMLLRATIEAAPSTSTLRHLNFGGVEFCLGGVIKVIAALTSLYYPLSKKFKVLRVLGTDVPLVDEVASVAMHIAVVCPNFAFVDLPHEHRKEFSLEIARAIAKRPFRPFADSIRHLMFKD